MGISCSCPFSKESDIETLLNSILVRSISFGAADEVKTTARSISFNDRGDSSEPAIMKSLVLGKMVAEGSINFKRREMETILSVTPTPKKENELVIRSIRKRRNQISGSETFKQVEPPRSITSVPVDSKHEAALKLQKVYKSFRTRRKLADCAVLVEQSWWKVLDYAELKRSSVSFFEIEKSETAISRWSRARTKAAKVGKGLSKNDRAQKLALQHWLEAIDPRHRYGHNLQFYYNKWLECQSRQPFFYWLDIGEGKEINLLDACPRLKLQHQCIKYLGPMEREVYEVIVKDGKFIYKLTEELLNTSGELDDLKWIFVLSTSQSLYVGQKMKGNFQHSSFLAGGATSAAGRLIVKNGTLKAVWPHSGHYRPTAENFNDFILFLEENNVDLTDVKMGFVDDEQVVLNNQKSSIGVPSNLSEEDLTETASGPQTVDQFSQEKTREDETFKASFDRQKSRKLLQYCLQLTSLVIPIKDDQIFGPSSKSPCPTGHGSYIDDQDEDEIETVPQEKIMQRINSHKGMKSYQLGRQLSCKWSSGAGPRIGCVRDYPSELQTHALEKVSLSPRIGRISKQNSTTGVTSSSSSSTTPIHNKTDNNFNNESPSLLGKTHLTQLCSPLSRGNSITAANLAASEELFFSF